MCDIFYISYGFNGRLLFFLTQFCITSNSNLLSQLISMKINPEMGQTTVPIYNMI